jgi:queuine/archaeosine tRNA-ribosyltransferase
MNTPSGGNGGCWLAWLFFIVEHVRVLSRNLNLLLSIFNVKSYKELFSNYRRAIEDNTIFNVKIEKLNEQLETHKCFSNGNF